MTGEGIDLCDLAVGVFVELADTRAENLRADESGDTADHMNGAGTGEVMKSETAQPAAAPDPVRFNGVDQRGNYAGIYAVGKELGALCHSARNDGSSGRAEDQVKDEVGKIEICVGCKNIKSRLADEPEQIFTHQQSETDQDKDHGADTEVHQVFHDNVASVLRPGEACLHHCESRLHPEYQCRADQKPHGKQLFGSCRRDILLDCFIHKESAPQKNRYLYERRQIPAGRLGS